MRRARGVGFLEWVEPRAGLSGHAFGSANTTLAPFTQDVPGDFNKTWPKKRVAAPALWVRRRDKGMVCLGDGVPWGHVRRSGDTRTVG